MVPSCDPDLGQHTVLLVRMEAQEKVYQHPLLRPSLELTHFLQNLFIQQRKSSSQTQSQEATNTPVSVVEGAIGPHVLVMGLYI